MRRALTLLAVSALLAGCGQRAGVHVRFVQQLRQPVAVGTTAHGASAKTRHSAGAKPVPTGGQRVPGGRRILRIEAVTRSATVTWPQWAALLLDRLQAPRCANNLIVVVAWEAQEGTRAGWNPLATTYDLGGSTLYNSAGVRNYATLDQGLDATVLTIEHGSTAHGYGDVVRSLRACNDPVTTARAINASDWCSGCAGGTYVLGVVPRIVAEYVASLKRT